MQWSSSACIVCFFFFLSWQIIDALTAHEQQIEAEPGRQMKRSSITNEKKSSPGRFGLCKAKVEVPLKTHLYPPIPGGGRNLAVMGASTSPSNFGWKPPETGALEVEGLRRASNLAHYPFSRSLEGKTWSQVAAFLLLFNYFTRRNAPSSHATIFLS